ncbi:MAG TPA: helix-turn-helix domain-containing protein [Candidatus Dojkabacteria bacterium]|nr:helix-turn-helix domain-containing protein [Candidatus Dojkabacteria bacterium]
MKSLDKELCPVMKAVEIIGDPTCLLIIRKLVEGPKRYFEIRDYINNISEATLSKKLKFLVTKGVIKRTYRKEIPPVVFYEIKKNIKELKNIIKYLEEFGDKYSR